MKENIKEKFGWIDLIKSILYLVDNNKKSYIFWNILRFLTFFSIVIPPLIVGLTVDFFMDFEKGDSLLKFYIYAATLTVLSTLLLVTRAQTKKHLIYIRFATICNIRVLGFEKLITLSLEEHEAENTGAKSQKIQNGAMSYGSIMNLLENRVLPSIATFTGILVVFLFLSSVYIIFFAIYLIIFFSLLRFYYKKIKDCNYKFNVSKEKASGSYIESLGNVLSIKSIGAEESFKNHISEKEETTKELGNKTMEIVLSQWTLFHILNSLSTGMFLFLIGRGVIVGSITVGSIVIFFSYLERMINSSTDILSLYQELIQSKTGLSRMMPIFWGATSKGGGNKLFIKNWKKIELNKVAFEYKKEDKEFFKGVKNVDLTIEKNSKIGLAGKTGSGKSTVAKLLVGLYEIDAGKYMIGDTNFYSIKNDEVLKNISIVLQESEMFNMSLKDNITLMHELDVKLFEKAIRVSQLEEVASKFPDGVDTLIGEKGYHLSGGERQRVGIARAIYKNAPIIIFDEATSSLDNKTEQLVQETLESDLDDKTLIFIAHRVATLKKADIIYVFKDGEIVEEGNYDQLIGNKDSEFYRLNKRR
ncbi:ABC transporter ATP-binding protein/permease [bacterium]|nr:ABC transporter ATP-binding protein/permease [bacterium]